MDVILPLNNLQDNYTIDLIYKSDGKRSLKYLVLGKDKLYIVISYSDSNKKYS